jgi:arylsulfatase A-like enzyme
MKQDNKRLNILWIEADDIVQTFLNKRGDGFGFTPNLDKLAEKGVFFSNSICQGPMCGPSRNSLLSNSYTHNLGFYRNCQMRCMPENQWTFPHVLKKQNYKTAYIGKSHFRPPAEDPDAGRVEALKYYNFDHTEFVPERFSLWKELSDGKDIKHYPFVQNLIKRGKYEQFLEDNNGYGKISSMTDDIDSPDGFTATRTVNWLNSQQNNTNPFFLWVAFSLPHAPYDASERWYDIAEKLDIPPPPTDSFPYHVPEPLIKDNWDAPTGEELKKMRIGEAANIAFFDAQIGKILDALETNGLSDNTAVFFFSDHSIFMGNHGRIHKGSLFIEPLRVSLTVSAPGHFLTNHVYNTPVELLDLVPTIFDIAGVNNPETAAKNGKSLLSILTGTQNKIERKFAFSEIYGAQTAIDSKGKYHYIVSENSDLLFDLEDDPYEMNNIAGAHPEIVKEMKNAITEWLNKTHPVMPPGSF